MDEKKPASPWDELVDVLGVEADPAALERRQPKSEIESVTRHDADKPRQAPKPKPGDWSALAGELGVEIPASEKSQRTTDFDELPELRSEFDKALVESMDDSDVEEESRPEMGMSGEAARTAFDALFAETSSEWSLPTSAGNVLDTPLEFTEEGSIAGEFDSELETATASEAEAPTEERPKRRRGRRRRGRGRGRGGEGEDSRQAERPPRDDRPDEETDEDGVEEVAEHEDASEGDSEQDERPRRRRSRRRGRGRGGRDSGRGERAPASTQSTSAVEDDDDEDDSADHQAGLFDLGDDEDDEAGDDEGGRQKANHRNLPTWSEALAVIIDANMAQRSKAPSRAPGGGGGRGRGRGGRGRKRN